MARRAASGVLLVLITSAAISCAQEESGSSGRACEAGQHGPYATQDTAWQRWREAQAQGFDVSNGIFICYDQSATRGYCYNEFCD